jgi:hypothetical protein
MRFVGSGRGTVWSAAVLTLAGCSFLVDTNSTQCASDGDCRGFGAYRCDTQRGVCVPTGPASAADGGFGAASVEDGGAQDGAVDGAGEAGFVDAGCMKLGGVESALPAEVTAETVLECGHTYRYAGQVVVRSGGTLRAEAGALVVAQGGTRARIVVEPGGRLVAIGTRDVPVVFTVAAEGGPPAAGDWDGIGLAGRARTSSPLSNGTFGFSGLGGTEDTANAAELTFVRIEYAREPLSLFATGAATRLESVAVNHPSSGCFAFEGGSAVAKHLICADAPRAAFRFASGYRGKVQFLLAYRSAAGPGPEVLLDLAHDPAPSSNLATEPVVYNATFCGGGTVAAGSTFGMTFSQGARGHLFDVLTMGQSACLDARGAGTKASVDSRGLTLFGSACAQNSPEAIAFDEDRSTGNPDRIDDDDGFDERGWFASPPFQNRVATDTGIDCLGARVPADLAPPTAIVTSAATPPDDGFFDPRAVFVGALRDRADGWASGAWAGGDPGRTSGQQ